MKQHREKRELKKVRFGDTVELLSLDAASRALALLSRWALRRVEKKRRTAGQVPASVVSINSSVGYMKEDREE